MLGLARLSRIFADSKIRIAEERVYECMVAAGACSMKANKVLHILEDSLIKYRAFFRWLTAAAAIVTNERMGGSPFDVNSKEKDFIFEYLGEIDSDAPNAEKDELGQFLADKEVTLKGDENSKNQWRRYLVENPCLEQFELVMPRFFDDKSLVQAHKLLAERADSIFGNFGDYVRQDFAVTCERDLFASAAAAGELVRKLSVVEVPGRQRVLIAFIEPRREEKLLQVVEIAPADGDVQTATVRFGEESGRFSAVARFESQKRVAKSGDLFESWKV